jgi:hypothetical protein
MLADSFRTAGILSLVLPLSLLFLVLAAWWLAVRRGGLKQSAPQEGDGGGGTESPGS